MSIEYTADILVCRYYYYRITFDVQGKLVAQEEDIFASRLVPKQAWPKRALFGGVAPRRLSKLYSYVRAHKAALGEFESHQVGESSASCLLPRAITPIFRVTCHECVVVGQLEKQSCVALVDINGTKTFLVVPLDLASRTLAQSIKQECQRVISQDWRWPPCVPSKWIEVDLTLVDAVHRAFLSPFKYTSHLAIECRRAPSDPLMSKCSECNKWVDKAKWAERDWVFQDFPLLTYHGFIKCMFASRVFCLSFSPSCPKVAHELALNLCYANRYLNVASECVYSLGYSILILVALRLLTWQRRDKDVLQLLALYSFSGRMDFKAPFDTCKKSTWQETPMDIYSWLAALVWIGETCSVKSFLIALLLSPPRFTRALALELRRIFASYNTMYEWHGETVQRCVEIMYNIDDMNRKQEYSTRAHERNSAATLAREIFQSSNELSNYSLLLTACSWIELVVNHPSANSALTRKNFLTRSLAKLLAAMGVESDAVVDLASRQFVQGQCDCTRRKDSIQSIASEQFSKYGSAATLFFQILEWDKYHYFCKLDEGLLVTANVQAHAILFPSYDKHYKQVAHKNVKPVLMPTACE